MDDLEEAARPLAVPKRCDLEALVPIGWAQLICEGAIDLPRGFVLAFCNFVFVQDSAAECAFTVTWLELVFMLESVQGFAYPVSDPRGGWLMLALSRPGSLPSST